MTNGKINGKKVLITGGGSGIGLTTATVLAKEGAIPILLDINPDALDEAIVKLRSESIEVRAFKADVTNIEEIRQLQETLESEEQIGRAHV